MSIPIHVRSFAGAQDDEGISKRSSLTREHGLPLWLALLILAAATLLAYGNSFSGPLVLDDLVNIADNASLRDLRDWRAVLWPRPPCRRPADRC